MDFTISINFKGHKDQFRLSEFYRTDGIRMFEKQCILISVEGEDRDW